MDRNCRTRFPTLLLLVPKIVGQHRECLVNLVAKNSLDLRALQADDHRRNAAGHLLKPCTDLDRRACDLTLKFIERSNLAPGLCGLEFREYRFRSQFAAPQFVFGRV